VQFFYYWSDFKLGLEELQTESGLLDVVLASASGVVGMSASFVTGSCNGVTLLRSSSVTVF
jgi:hypothetical protein